jgi:hypothetical protein
MLNKGKWVSKSDEKWEPSGCMAKAYRDKDIKSCLEKTRILYIGDSIMREQFYSMTKLSMPIKQQMNVHIDQKFVSKDKKLTVEMWWDPYLNETKTLDFLSGKMKDDRPSLLMIGSGVWHMRRLDNDYLEEWKMATDRVFNAAQNHHIADKMLLSPVEVVTHELLTPERKETITFDKITITNNYLRERERNLPLLKTPLRIPFVWNEMVTSSTKQTKDGLHFLSKVTTAQAQIALNYRCNEQLDKSFPVVNTCCSTYMEPQWYQKVIFFYFLCFVPLGFYVLQASSGKLQPGFYWFKNTLFPN